jgi:arabinosyltransferase B
VSSYGVPFNNEMPRIAGISVSLIFFALFLISALYTGWLHFASRVHGEGRVVRVLTAAPIPVAAGFMVLVFIASMTAGVVRQYPTYSNALANIRSLSGGCGLADDVLVEPDTNVGFMTPLPGDYGPLGPLGGTNPVGFTPNGVPEHIVAEAIRVLNPTPGIDYDWEAPVKLDKAGINGSKIPLPYGLDPDRVPVAGSYVGTAQKESLLTSAWYLLPDAADQPLVVVTAAGTIAGNSVLKGKTDGQTIDLEYARPGPGPDLVPAGRVQPYDLGPAPSWRNLRYPRSAIPADATAVRIVAEDRSLSLGDWIAVTPPRVPRLLSVQDYVGSTQPVLMDWAVGLAFPCQQPMLHSNGVTQVPKFRITPDYTAKKQDTDTWEDGRNGGLLGISDVMLRAHVMATYLSEDWGRDWGSLRRFDTILDAEPAQIDLGTATRSGLWSPGRIRIKA